MELLKFNQLVNYVFVANMQTVRLTEKNRERHRDRHAQRQTCTETDNQKDRERERLGGEKGGRDRQTDRDRVFFLFPFNSNVVRPSGAHDK